MTNQKVFSRTSEHQQDSCKGKWESYFEKFSTDRKKIDFCKSTGFTKALNASNYFPNFFYFGVEKISTPK